MRISESASNRESFTWSIWKEKKIIQLAPIHLCADDWGPTAALQELVEE